MIVGILGACLSNLLHVRAESKINLSYGFVRTYSSGRWSTLWILVIQSIGVAVGSKKFKEQGKVH